MTRARAEHGVVRMGPAVIVAIAAAAVTAHGLVGVAEAARVPVPMAWAYPVITDGLALVAYRATSRLSGAGARYAWTVVVAAAGISGLAQAVFLASESLTEAPPGLRFGVGAWPAIAAAVAAHLLHLLATPSGEATRSPVEPDSPPLAAGPQSASEPEPQVDSTHRTGSDARPGRVEPGAEGDQLDPRVRALVEDLTAGTEVTGAEVAARFDCSPRTGRRLLTDARTHLDSTADRPVQLHAVESA